MQNFLGARCDLYNKIKFKYCRCSLVQKICLRLYENILYSYVRYMYYNNPVSWLPHEWSGATRFSNGGGGGASGGNVIFFMGGQSWVEYWQAKYKGLHFPSEWAHNKEKIFCWCFLFVFWGKRGRRHWTHTFLQIPSTNQFHCLFQSLMLQIAHKRIKSSSNLGGNEP